MQMMRAVNKLQIKKGRADEVIARFKKAKSVHTFEGFVIMEVLKKENTEQYDEVHVCTTWKDRSYFDAWRESTSSKKAHKPKEEKKQQPEDNPILGAELSTYEISIQHHPDK